MEQDTPLYRSVVGALVLMHRAEAEAVRAAATVPDAMFLAADIEAAARRLDAVDERLARDVAMSNWPAPVPAAPGESYAALCTSLLADAADLLDEARGGLEQIPPGLLRARAALSEVVQECSMHGAAS